MRNVRQVTKSNSPDGQAVWTLSSLHSHLSSFLFETYDTIEHPALGQTPRDAYLAGLRTAGVRANRMIAYDQVFLMATLPSTHRGTAKVSPGRGVKVNGVRYWAEAFRDPSVENCEVAIRYDPFDMGTAYAFLSGRWTECHSILEIVEEKKRVEEIDGIGCQPVLISATTEEVLEWIGDGLRSGRLAFPDHDGLIVWPRIVIATMLGQCATT
jgi:putative transposase